VTETDDDLLQVEAQGETVGEAKWLALRELEQLHPGLERELVTFEVLSEGERGLLGVGTSPARVLARFEPGAIAERGPTPDESELARLVRDLLERVADALGARCRVDIAEDAESLTASLTGANVGLLIGRHGRTIDAVQYVTAAVGYRVQDEPRKAVLVDAGGYRERREARLREIAQRSAARARQSGETVSLEPMASLERKLIHLHLKDMRGVETRSEGEEPNRFVVVVPTGE
jgi:spoIIIJ-associated protein